MDNRQHDPSFWARISSRIIAKVLKKTKKKRSWISLLWEKTALFCSFVVAKISKQLAKYPIIKRYSPQVAFVILFFLILHPGIYSRAVPNEPDLKVKTTKIPPRSHLYPRENIHSIVQQNHLQLFLKDQLIASYPVFYNDTIPGDFRVIKIDNTNGIWVYLQEMKTQQLAMITGRDIQARCSHIELDEDGLETIYSYFRLGTAISIKP